MFIANHQGAEHLKGHRCVSWHDALHGWSDPCHQSPWWWWTGFYPGQMGNHHIVTKLDFEKTWILTLLAVFGEETARWEFCKKQGKDMGNAGIFYLMFFSRSDIMLILDDSGHKKIWKDMILGKLLHPKNHGISSAWWFGDFRTLRKTESNPSCLEGPMILRAIPKPEFTGNFRGIPGSFSPHLGVTFFRREWVAMTCPQMVLPFFHM